MVKNLKNIINQFSDDANTLNKILVSVFIKSNNLNVERNRLIKSLIVHSDSELYSYIEFFKNSFSFDDLIEAFELAIPKEDKVVNGAVYTPNYIKSFIVENSISKLKVPLTTVKTADISCGCGAFLFTIANKLRIETKKSFFEIFRDNIWGLDICENSIKRTEILLSLLAISVDEDIQNFEFNLFCGNALSFDWKSKSKSKKKYDGFDLIVGNPPYVRARNIDDITKKMLSNWGVTKSGNPDLYIPFFEIALENLKSNGVLGYITVNSFFKSVNARRLREYFQQKQYDINIIDFGDEKIFENISAYTCICFIVKSNAEYLLYKKETSHTLIDNNLKYFNEIKLSDLDANKGWLLNNNLIITNIKKIERAGKNLGEEYKIKNGIATLSNDIYIFKPVDENDNYYFLKRNDKVYKIEKNICREIIKPNILKNENEIENVKEKIIYPYTNGVTPLTLISEDNLKSNFPNTYKYLRAHKKELKERDGGNGKYPEWYAFGRTQALTDKGYKLLFPYMAKEPHFVFTDQKDMLIYCGYAIFDESVEELKILKRILESKVFDYYMQNTSKPYSSGYLSYAKNYVKGFGICKLTEEDKYFLLNGETKEEIDNFLIKKYKIKI